jgi:hypothetical protein
LVAFAPIDLKDAIIRLKDGFGNSTYSPTVGTAGAILGASVVPITPGTMGLTVPVGAHCRFAGDVSKYQVTARTVNATGQDEVQSAAAIASTSGTFNTYITLPGNSATAVITDFDETSATMQTKVDAALAGQEVNGIAYVAGDITVAGGPQDTTAITYTFDGTSVAKMGVDDITTADIDLNDSTPPVVTTTTVGIWVGSTESITVTPVLAAAVTSGDAITFLPIELDIKIGEGNMTYDENREVEYIRNRGVLDTYKEGDEQPMDVSFDFTWEFLYAISGATTPTIEQALKQVGPASVWTSSNTADPCAPYVVDVEIENAPDCGDILAEVIVLPYFFHTQLSHDADAAQVSVTGQCNAKQAVITRVNRTTL